MTGVYNITINRGGTFSRTITGVDSANVNIFASATAAQANFRESFTANTIIPFTCSFNANNQILTISMNVSTTNSIASTNGVWDLRITYPDKVTYPLAGTVTVNQRATR